jgi:hypothetical protein
MQKEWLVVYHRWLALPITIVVTFLSTSPPVAGIATLASAPGAPQHVQILVRALDNDSTLQWDPPAGAPEWQRAVNTKALSPNEAGGVSVTLPIAKDNVIFGVRSLDARGHRSLAVVPWPTR